MKKERVWTKENQDFYDRLMEPERRHIEAIRQREAQREAEKERYIEDLENEILRLRWKLKNLTEALQR